MNNQTMLRDDVVRLLFDRCCQFAHDAMREAEARGDVLVGTPIVVVDLRRCSIGLTMVGAAGYAPEIALEAGDAALAEIVGRFVAAGLGRLPLEKQQMAATLHTSGAATLALVVPLAGDPIRITCVSAPADDPRRMAHVFTSALDESPIGPAH